MKKALLLTVFLISLGFVSRAWDGVEFRCDDSATVSNLVGQLGWKLWDALLDLGARDLAWPDSLCASALLRGWESGKDHRDSTSF